jgi:hypothetical protein
MTHRPRRMRLRSTLIGPEMPTVDNRAMHVSRLIRRNEQIGDFGINPESFPAKSALDDTSRTPD